MPLDQVLADIQDFLDRSLGYGHLTPAEYARLYTAVHAPAHDIASPACPVCGALLLPDTATTRTVNDERCIP